MVRTHRDTLATKLLPLTTYLCLGRVAVAVEDIFRVGILLQMYDKVNCGLTPAPLYFLPRQML